eukprot:284817962_2
MTNNCCPAEVLPFQQTDVAAEDINKITETPDLKISTFVAAAFDLSVKQLSRTVSSKMKLELVRGYCVFSTRFLALTWLSCCFVQGKYLITDAHNSSINSSCLSLTTFSSAHNKHRHVAEDLKEYAPTLNDFKCDSSPFQQSRMQCITHCWLLQRAHLGAKRRRTFRSFWLQALLFHQGDFSLGPKPHLSNLALYPVDFQVRISHQNTQHFLEHMASIWWAASKSPTRFSQTKPKRLTSEYRPMGEKTFKHLLGSSVVLAVSAGFEHACIQTCSAPRSQPRHKT